MANVSITVRMDSEIKQEAEEFFAEIGMSMTGAFNVFVKQCLRERRIPFEITADPRSAGPYAAYAATTGGQAPAAGAGEAREGGER